MIKAIIFDFGGVLMRTGEPHGRRKWEARLGLPSGQLERVVHGSEAWLQVQRGALDLNDYWILTAHVLNVPDSDVPALRADYFRDDHLDHGLMALIASLRSLGYRVGLLSNDALALETKLRDDLHIYDAFDAVIISADIGVMKPDPAAYYAAARALQVGCAECVFIDDNDANVEGARQVGMQAIHFQAGMPLGAALTRLLDKEL